MVIRPGGLAEFVDDDGQVVAVGAEVAQQVVQPLRFGHEHGRAQQRAQVQLGRALQLEQVLGHQDADDVLALAVVHREARVRGADDRTEQFVVGRVDVQQVHARRGHHHVAGTHVGHAQHAFEHLARFGLDQLAVFGIGQRGDQFGAGIGARGDEFDQAFEQRSLVRLLARVPGRLRF